MLTKCLCGMVGQIKQGENRTKRLFIYYLGTPKLRTLANRGQMRSQLAKSMNLM